MKKILILPLLAFISLIYMPLSAQVGSAITLDESSIRLEQTDALGGVNIDPIGKDRSNRECFRLKLRLDRMTPEEIANVEVKLVGGNVVMMKRAVASGGNGLILEMTARPVRLYIKHPSLGESNTVNINPEGNKVYIMEGWADQKLTVVVSCAKVGADVWMDGEYRGKTGQNMAINIPEVMAGPHVVKVQSGYDTAEQQIEVSSANVLFNIELQSAAHLQQFVVFKVTPKDAMVELAGEMLFVSDGMAQKLVRYGTYNYVVEARNYYTETGSVVVGETTGKKVMEVNLKPSFGRVEVKGASVSGASVYIDKQRVGTAPVLSEALSPGMHNVRIVKDMYNSYEADVEVREGETTTVSPVLEKNFAELTLVSQNGASIWIDGDFKAVGTWTGTLTKGLHAVECRKEGYALMTESLNVEPGMDGSRIVLSAMTPLYGMLQVSSNPMMADVYMDGTNIGQTPIYLPEALVGRHELKIRMNGYNDWTSTINVAEGQLCEVNCTLDKASVQAGQQTSASILPSLLRSRSVDSGYGKYGRNSANCIRYLSYYNEYFRQKNYDSAIVYWRNAYRLCPPNSRYAMLVDGTAMLKKQLSKNISPSYRAELLDSLKTLYAERIEYFPKYSQSAKNNFALDMINYMEGSPLELWKILREVAGDLQSKTRLQIMVEYMDLTGRLYQSGRIATSDGQAAYELGYKYLKETADQGVEKELTPCLDKLKSYLGAAELHPLPAALSGDSQSADQVILSLLSEKKYTAAYEKCQEFMKENPDLAGAMYMYMGKIWAELYCKGSDIDARARFWVATDYMVKAKSADPSLAADCDNYIRQYEAYYPQTAEAFMYDIMDGQQYVVSCSGMRAVTTVRTKR
jgi:hypothetical protein